MTDDTESWATQWARLCHKESKEKAVRVLVVDDDPADSNIISESLTDCHTHVVSSRKDAIALVESGLCPDIAVVDYFLPAPEGIEVINKIHRACPNAFCVLVTGRDIDGDITSKAMDAGACGFIRKGVSLTDELIPQLRRLVGERVRI